MKKIKYHMDLVEMESFKNKMMESTKELNYGNIKVATKDCFLLGSWFDPKRLAEAFMDVVANIIGMVKINTKGFYKGAMEKLKRIGNEALNLC